MSSGPTAKRGNDVRVSMHRVWEVARYSAGCGCSVLIKLAVTSLATAAGVPLRFGYLAALFIVIFFSYAYHSRITFRRKAGSFRELARSFSLFTGSMLVFHLLDYLLVVLGAGMLAARLAGHGELSALIRQLLVSGCIVCVSGGIFLIRYSLFRVIFVGGRSRC